MGKVINFLKELISKMKTPFLLASFLMVSVLTLDLLGNDFFGDKDNYFWLIGEDIVKYCLILNIYWFVFIVSEHFIDKFIDLNVKKRNQASTFRVLDISAKAVFIVVLFLHSLDFWGVDITKFLAAGGIMGLAIGLAAKDFLSNLFGGLVVFMDRPFKEGDWIASPDRSIEGVVKKIKLRVTEIETFDKRPLYIPNSTFLNIVIENAGRMKNRRIRETFSLRYKDADQVKKIVYEIESYLKGNLAIETGSDSTILVNLNHFSASSLDCEVYCFTKTASWKLYREIKQEVMLEIMNIVKNNKADMAFPTRTIELKNQKQNNAII